jgi:predicted transcriptional regulator
VKNREVKEMTVLTIRITEEEKEALQRISDKTDLSMSHIVRQLIKQFLKKHQQ